MSFLKWFAGANVPVVKKDEPEDNGPTYCGGDKFFEGPSGGMSTNILCANPDCRHWFNWHAGILPMDDLHRVEPSNEEKASQADAKQLERDREFSERLNIGATSYREHGSIAALRQQQFQVARWTYPKPEEIDQLCGFIMGMCDEIKTLREKVAELELMARTAVVVAPDMLEHRGADGTLLGHVRVMEPGRPAYGPGSITDAASYRTCPYTDQLCHRDCLSTECKNKTDADNHPHMDRWSKEGP